MIAEAATKIKETARTNFLAGVAKGIVSLIQKTLILPKTHKEGVRIGQASRFREIFKTAAIGASTTKSKIGKTASALVIGFSLLAPLNTESQNPTWKLFGVDRHYKQYKPRGEWISLFYRWRTEEHDEVFVYKQGSTYNGLATKKVWLQHAPGDDNYIPGYIHHSYKKTLHLNKGDPSFSNMDNYNMDRDGTKLQILASKIPRGWDGRQSARSGYSR